MVLCASAAHGWVSFESFFGSDVLLRDYEPEQKGPLFSIEEMGVLLGNFG